ncbi:prenyltransferase/squalene oxidase repeat-containing protein [Streptomyces sp. NPDC018321]|uniref:prenyltransferase/squalene oxidase repeat-containing protein n=1 Tax=unclassified Streptomyces TaxID=2593676 RepID=UPI00379D7F71
MNVRRRSSAAALAAIAVIGAATAPAVAADPSPSKPTGTSGKSGLYGSTDPQFDGVWRQSLALLAQDTAGVVPSSQAVKWLTDQQCDNGAFAPFRPDPAKACDAKTTVDTNSTAAAVQALWAVGGHGDAVKDALDWLKSVQNKDGGWGYTPGSPSEANSTSVVIGALTATETDPETVEKGGKSPYDALLASALPCAEDGGAFGYPDQDGKLVANADATAAGVLGALGTGLVTEAGEKTADAGCTTADEPTREQAAANGAAYLADALAKDGHLTSALGGSAEQPDYGNTADAVVALAAQGGADKAAKPLAWLEKNAAKWAKESGPAAYAQLILAAHATGTDPRAFGGTDLVAALNATGPAPQGMAAKDTATASNDDDAKDEKEDGKKDDSGFGVWWFVGVCLVFGIGIGFLLSGRNKKQQP